MRFMNGWVEGHKTNGIYETVVKRPSDFCLALILSTLLSPLFLVLYFAVWANMGRPVIFTQERPGLGGKIFKLKKFRTMTNRTDDMGNLLPDSERLTRFGRLLRKSSLDELPELINILKGELSFVGPRPLLVEYLPYYDEVEKHRHDVRPGLTGLAQVNGRNNLGWKDRFALDVEYVNNISFALDIKIIALTIKKVIIKDGILEDSSQGESNFAKEREAEYHELSDSGRRVEK